MAQYLYPQIQNGIGNNGINPLLFPAKIAKQIIHEYIQTSVFNYLIGDEPTRPIVRHKFKEGDGLAYRVGRLNALDYKNPVMDFDQCRGKEQVQNVDQDTVFCNKRTFQVKITGVDILKYGTPIDLHPEARSQLIQVNYENFDWEIMNCITFSAYPNILTANTNVAGTVPSFDRVSPGKADTTRAAWNANNTFPTYVNGYQTPANTDCTNTGLSVKHLQQTKFIADRGGQEQGNEFKIRPAFMRNQRNLPMYGGWYYFAHPETLPSLQRDPLFIQTATGRGVISDENQPQMINGSTYFGDFLGMKIYALPADYARVISSADGLKRVAWNFLMGAAAVDLGIYEEMSVRMDPDDRESQIVYYTKEIRGQKMLQFPSRYAARPGAVVGSNPLVEQGVVHSFVSF